METLSENEILKQLDAGLVTENIGEVATFATAFEAFAVEATPEQIEGLPVMLGTGFTSVGGGVDED